MQYTREFLLDLLDQRMKQWSMSKDEITRAAGLPRDALKDFKRGKATMLRGDKMQKLVAVLRPEDEDVQKPLAEIAAPLDEEYSAIAVYDVKASAGPGALVSQENVLYYQSFKTQWLRSLTRAPLDKLGVIEVMGDSMAESLRPGDMVLVDLTRKTPNDDGIYAIQYEGGLVLKRVTIDYPRRKIMLSSDNPAYPPIEPYNAEEVSVAGRVILKWSRL